MLAYLLLLGILVSAFFMVSAKRIGALINGFSAQALFLFMITVYAAAREKSLELYIIAGLLFVIKVLLIPVYLRRIVKRIKVNEDLGLFLNPSVSLFVAAGLVYLAYLFAGRFVRIANNAENSAFVVSISIVLIGIFIMVFRMKALAQMVGLLVMENGLFLLAATISGGMPFFVEIAIFFDIFLCVIILEIFVYKINKLFTHIDVDKLTELKG
jgi:Hydrogenase 4 membrane component (E)